MVDTVAACQYDDASQLNVTVDCLREKKKINKIKIIKKKKINTVTWNLAAVPGDLDIVLSTIRQKLSD